MIKTATRALVTGGSGGIGAAICRRLGLAGYFVYVHAHRGTQAAAAIVGEIVTAGGRAAAVQFDLTDSAATRTSVERLLEDGPVQILVNNAGIHDDAVFPGMSPVQWHRVIDLSVNGFYNVTQPLMLPMIRTRWGRIINLSSVAALIGNRGQVNYAAAKGALNAATKALSLEVASRGITVNAVAPGIISTRMGEAAFDAAAIAEMVPMKRAGTAEEVASLVGFLASEEAAYITGQIISINGGAREARYRRRGRRCRCAASRGRRPIIGLRLRRAFLKGALRNVHTDLGESLRAQHFAQLRRARFQCIARHRAMTREPHLRVIPLHGDAHFDGPELRRVHLQFRAVQIVIHHP